MRLSGALLVVLLLAAGCAQPDDGDPSGTARSTDAAATTPRSTPPDVDVPEEFADHEVLVLEGRVGEVELDDDTDYWVHAPATVQGPVTLTGGGDVVWVAGHVTVPDPGAVVGAGDRLGVLLRDDGGEADRTIHLEGLLLDGDGLSEGIDLDVPSAQVQLRNIHVATVRFANADDRDGTGAYEGLRTNHPDVLQTYGGHRGLDVDGLTGSTGYQGLFFKEDHDDAPNAPVRLQRVNLHAETTTGTEGFTYAANRLYFIDVGRSGDHYIDTGTVWVDHSPDAGKVAADPNPREGSSDWWRDAYRVGDELVADEPPGTAVFTDALERKDDDRSPVPVPPTAATDDLGEYASWPELYDAEGDAHVYDETGEGPGRIYSGVPPGGDYVPADSVGTDYAG